MQKSNWARNLPWQMQVLCGLYISKGVSRAKHWGHGFTALNYYSFWLILVRVLLGYENVFLL